MIKEIEKAVEAATNETILKLKVLGYIIPKTDEKNAFQKTEMLLYNYNNFKAAIKDKEAQIEYVLKNGLEPVSKSIIPLKAQSQLPADKLELAEEFIEALRKSILITKNYIDVIDNALDSIKDDRYYDIIRLKYFEGLVHEEIGDRLFCDSSTISRQKNRLIDALKIRLFSDEVIMGLF